MDIPQSAVEKLKRVGVTLLTIGLFALNKKLGLGLEFEELGSISAVALGYVLSGTWKDHSLKKAAMVGAAKAAEVDSLAKATEVLKEAMSEKE